MPKIDVSGLKPLVGSKYPKPFDEPCRTRERRRLGEAADLSQFGVNLLRLPPGDNFRVATGRVLTATGLPVCTARENSLGLNVGGDSSAFDFQLGRDGRFAVPLRLAASDDSSSGAK